MKREHILITNFNGNPNVGLYGFANDKYCLIGREVPEKLYKKIEEILDVKVIPITIAGTSLIGVFLNGNNKTLLVPNIIFENEIEILRKNKIKYNIMNTKYTCLGNNMVINDNGAIISPDYGSREINQINDSLGVNMISSKIANHKTVGSLIAHNKKGLLCHNDLNENDAKTLKKILRLKITTGTINMGNPFIRSGILCNSKGMIIGDFSGGPEIMNAEEALFK
ncbi:MAG: translation initiation factor IF-6 [Candidatus Woesearchaeota archaeon]